MTRAATDSRSAAMRYLAIGIQVVARLFVASIWHPRLLWTDSSVFIAKISLPLLLMQDSVRQGAKPSVLFRLSPKPLNPWSMVQRRKFYR